MYMEHSMYMDIRPRVTITRGSDYLVFANPGGAGTVPEAFQTWLTLGALIVAVWSTASLNFS